MSIYKLSKAFRCLHIFRKDIISKNLSTQQKTTSDFIFSNSANWHQNFAQNVNSKIISFTPQAIINVPTNRLPITNIDLPNIFNVQINDPTVSDVIKGDIGTNKVIEIPSVNNIVEKHAVRMIVIRRKKMKRHKRRKFLKKWKFFLRKKKQRKDVLREIRFQAEMQEMILKAKSFDAKQYVQERLDILLRERQKTTWRGIPCPEDVLKQLIKEREERKAEKQRLLNYRLKLEE